MLYSHSQDGDIIVHFVSGGQQLWSRLRSLSWAEIERVASGENLGAIAPNPSKSLLPN
jgi:hypothetical protein